MDLDARVIESLEAALHIPLDRSRIRPETPLMGAIPEFDSMAAVALLTALEERFGFTIADDEFDGATFATFGSLNAFVQGKLDALGQG